jgi:hypothetical protein
MFEILQNLYVLTDLDFLNFIRAAAFEPNELNGIFRN